jgi:hypothetical protein
MLSAEERKRRKRGFAEGETSLRLEGLTPTPFGESLKERVLAGEMDSGD